LRLKNDIKKPREEKKKKLEEYKRLIFEQNIVFNIGIGWEGE